MTAALLGGLVALVVAEVAWPWAVRPRHRNATPTFPRSLRRAAAALGALAGALLAPPLVPLAALAWWGNRALRRRRRDREHARSIRQALPDLVDLLRLATTAGLSLPIAHPLVAHHAAEPLRRALLDADATAGRGRPRADALTDALTPLGDRARALAHVLSDHLRYGVPLLPALDRVGLELRLDRRRAAEVEARRVPVRLLGPLVTCVLPAFALLTVVPLLVASFAALPL